MKKKATVFSLGSLIAALLFILVVAVPVFAAAPIVNNQTLSILEGSAPGSATTPNKISAFDPEGNHNANLLEFDILSGGDDSVFEVGFNTGIVTLAAGQSLDYETKTSYTFTVRVQDTEDLADTAVITVNVTDVSDEPPVMGNQSFGIAENSANNALVGKLVFTDIDVNDSHTFAITGGNGSGAGAFQIDAGGNLRVKDTTQLNFEATTQFLLGVEVKDLGNNTDTATITVNVTNVNEKPNVNDTAFNGLSESAPNGTVVGTVTATDPDGDTLQFMWTSGSQAFTINGTTGEVTVANSALLNFETTPSPEFVVTVSDGKGQTDTATIKVNLVDVNDPPRVTGSGLADVIVNVGTASATRNLWAAFEDDEDADNELTFTVHSNDNPGLFASPPSINLLTGVLTMNFANGANGVANLTIRAFDSGGEFVADTFKVDFNEAPVAVGFADVTVSEDAANTSINLYNGFTDAEQPSSELVYAIESNTNAGLFTSVTINLPNLVLDYAPDANGLAEITIKATDVGNLSATTKFTVKVNALNDPPTTTGIGNVTVAEDAPDTVIKLDEAFDDKEDDPKQLTFTVQGNTNPNLFDDVTINQGQGTLTLGYKPNTSGAAELTIRATDKGGLFIETKFTVTVGEINDLPILSNITKNITEDIPYQFTLADFTSKFADDDGDELVNVRIESLPADGTLKLNNVDVTLQQVIAAADLSKLAFIPDFNWDEGSTSFEWNASDGAAYAVAKALVTFNVQSINDAPIISDVEKQGQEGGNVIFALSDFSAAFTDLDGDALNKIRIEELPAHGSLKLGNVNVTDNQQINAVNIADLRYVPDQFFFGQDTFGWAGSDGLIYSSPAQVILTITPTNDAPAIDLNGNGQGTGFSTTFVTGGSPVVIAGQNTTITDVDDTMMEGATIVIINRVHGTKEILDANVTGTNITKQFNAGGGILLLSGADTIENYQKVIKTITFKIESDVTNPDTATVREISVRVYDGELNSNDAIAKVKVINPRIEITVTPPIQTVAKGTPAVFTVVIKNTGSVALHNIQVTSAAVPDCNRTFEDPLAAGASLSAFVCIVNNVQARIDNEVVVTAIELETNKQVTADDEAIVRVLQNVSIDIAPDPAVGDTLVKGQNAIFNVTIVNPSQADLSDVEVKAYVDYDLALNVATPAANVPAPTCDKVIGALGPGKQTSYSCTIPNVQASFKVEVEVDALIDGITPTTDFDVDEIAVLDMSLEVFAVPFELLAGEVTTVEFSMTLANVSNVPLTLSTLSSNLHGNLLDAANSNVSNNSCPGLSLSIPKGEVRTCSYEVAIMLESAALTNVITANATGGNNKQLTVVDEALVSVAEFSPMVVVVGANPASVVAPGGPVNLTVQVTNNTSSELTLDALNDSVVGNLDGQGNCEMPRTIQGNGSYSCTYTITISGKKAGDVVTHTVTAVADAKEASNSVAIPVTSGEQTYLLLPSVSSNAIAGEPNNRICAGLTIGVNQTSFFYSDDATDWYTFKVATDSNVKVKLSNYLVKGQIVVYSGDCNKPSDPVGHNGDVGIIATRELNLGLLKAGIEYHILVIADGQTNKDTPYTLRVESTSP